MSLIQVNQGHYDFNKYVNTDRWMGYHQQICEILKTGSTKILEIGVGRGITKAVLTHLGLLVISIDIDPELKPDVLGSLLNMPFKDKEFETTVCFQVLEHLPYSQFIDALNELKRVTSKTVLLSLPDSRFMWSIRFRLPFVGKKYLQIPHPRLRGRKHVFTGEHHWEVSKRGYPVKKIIADMKKTGLKLLSTYRLQEAPYFRFLYCQYK